MIFEDLTDYELGLVSQIEDMGPFVCHADVLALLQGLSHLNGRNAYVTSLFASYSECFYLENYSDLIAA